VTVEAELQEEWCDAMVPGLADMDPIDALDAWNAKLWNSTPY